MNTLLITAQPASKGFVHQIAKQYEGTKKTKGDDVEIIDLYNSSYALPFLKFEDEKEMPENAVIDILQEKIAAADDLVFVFPLWWGSMPAILKNFFDTVLQSGFAFVFEKGRPKPLLKGKTAKVIITCDAPTWLYFFIGFPIKKLITKMILGFCGIKVTDFVVYGKISFQEEKEKKKILEKITRLALK